MAGILVYLPKATGGTALEQFPSLGLQSLTDPAVVSIPTEVRNGPDGSHGVLVTFDAMGLPATPRAVDLETQHWHAAPPDGELAKGRYWLGYVKDAKPSAGELQRPKLIDGEAVQLSDGNQWAIPIAEYAPKRLTRDPETGDEIEVAKDQFKRWVDWTNVIYRLIVNEQCPVQIADGYTVNVPNGLAYAALTLSQNYRVNYDVVDVLGLVDKREAAEIAMVATGIRLIATLSAQKKNTEPLVPAV
jgi:hypothetical protein